MTPWQRSTNAFDVPEGMPVLSAGRHRSPRRGACFMEFASYLAGERWSDHPACTHALLAALTRHVNDVSSDAGRQRLAPLIPSVVGVTSDDPRLDVRIALRAATTALPVVSEERQRLLAVSVLVCEDRLAELEGRRPGSLEPASRAALETAPGAQRWARSFRARTGNSSPSPTAFRRHAAPQAVHCAVTGIAQACVAEPERLLHELLVAAVDDCRQLVGLEATTPVAGRVRTVTSAGT